jgi:hypothetical protein
MWRMLAAAAGSWKAFAYRNVVHLNQDCTVSVAEILVVIAYFTTVWVWCLINSAFFPKNFTPSV